jgi:hypothetical protein
MFAFDRYRKEKAWHAAFPGEPSLALMGVVHGMVEERVENGISPSNDLRKAEAYLVTRYGHLITNDAVWNNPHLAGTLANLEEKDLRELVRDFQPLDPVMMTEAEREVPIWLRIQAQSERVEPLWVVSVVLLGGFILFAVVDLFSAIAFGVHPILHLFGISTVSRQGAPASRARLLGRAALVWTVLGIAIPIISVSVALELAPLAADLSEKSAEAAPDSLKIFMRVMSLLSLAMLGVFVALAVRHPARSVQDRVAGTALVPR